MGEGICELLQTGKWEEAVVACQACIQIQPAVGKFHAALGEAYFQLHRYREAEPCFLRAYTLDPHLGQSAVRHAQSLERLHRYRDAYEVVKEWIRILPNDYTLAGLEEFLLSQPGTTETDKWEQTRHLDTIVIDASFHQEDVKVDVSESEEEPSQSSGRLRFSTDGGGRLV